MHDLVPVARLHSRWMGIPINRSNQLLLQIPVNSHF
jgi:hypothetical protein